MQHGKASGSPLPSRWAGTPRFWACAFYVVQRRAGVTIKMLAVTLASYVVTVGMYELVIRRVAPLRALFGMKARPRTPNLQPQEAAPASGVGTPPAV